MQQAAAADNDEGLLLSRPREHVDVTLRGVQLKYVLQLAASDAYDLDPSWTILQAVDRFARPRSKEFETCLFDLVPAPHTGRPCYFVSHTWSRRLGDLLDLLRDHFEGVGVDPADAFIWLDLFCINQHPYTGTDPQGLQNDDVLNLARVLQATDQTLFCLDEQLTSLTRAWCLVSSPSDRAGRRGRATVGGTEGRSTPDLGP